MKLLFWMRGNHCTSDQFITELRGKYLPYEAKRKPYALQLNVQPIRLYCLGFPKEHLQIVLNTIKPRGSSKMRKFGATILRKALGLKKVPKQDIDIPGLPILTPSAELGVIGMLDDGTFESGVMKDGEAI